MRSEDEKIDSFREIDLQATDWEKIDSSILYDKSFAINRTISYYNCIPETVSNASR